MKTILSRIVPIALVLLLAVTFLAACSDAPPPRVQTVYTYSPGAAFSTNYANDDLRRQIKCSIIFEVLDEQAIEELTAFNYRVRSSVLAVLGELTTEEIHTEKDLEIIGYRIVERVNMDLQNGGVAEGVNLILKTYFTEFAVI